MCVWNRTISFILCLWKYLTLYTALHCLPIITTVAVDTIHINKTIAPFYNCIYTFIYVIFMLAFYFCFLCVYMINIYKYNIFPYKLCCAMCLFLFYLFLLCGVRFCVVFNRLTSVLFQYIYIYIYGYIWRFNYLIVLLLMECFNI